MSSHYIEGFKQETIIKLDLDMVDVVFLRWFLNAKDANILDVLETPHGRVYWIKYSWLASRLPALQLSEERLRKRLSSLAKKGVLTHYHHKVGGNWSYYGVGKGLQSLIAMGAVATMADELGYAPPISPSTPPTLPKESPKPKVKKEAFPCPDDVDPEVFTEWMELRKAKTNGKDVITQRTIAVMRTEATKAKLTLQQAVETCLNEGWKGFKAEYVKKQRNFTTAKQPAQGIDYNVTHWADTKPGIWKSKGR